MATTITLSSFVRTIFGNKRIVIADCAFGSTDYPVAGISLTPEDFGLTTIDYLIAENGTLVYKYDYSNEKLLAYTAAGSTGATVILIVATDADPSETIKIMVIGSGLA